MGTEVVTFGEVLLRLSPPASERLFQSPLLHTSWGGAEANVAAGLAHLGCAARHVTVLPTGPIGDAALRALRGDGVNVCDIVRRDGRMGTYFVEAGADIRPIRVTYDRAHSAFADLDPAQFDWPAILQGARWLHVGGIAPALGEGPLQATRDAIAAANALQVPVSLDLNYRAALWSGRDPKTVVPSLAAQAQTVIGNPGAIASMLGVVTDGVAPETPAAIRTTMQRLHEQFGCQRVVITQREVLSASEHAWQAHSWDASDHAVHFGGRHRVAVVDRAGGGDAFAAGLIHMLLQGATAADAVRFATAAGALKLTIPGDVNRVTPAEVQQLLTAST